MQRLVAGALNRIDASATLKSESDEYMFSSIRGQTNHLFDNPFLEILKKRNLYFPTITYYKNWVKAVWTHSICEYMRHYFTHSNENGVQDAILSPTIYEPQYVKDQPHSSKWVHIYLPLHWDLGLLCR